MRILSCLTVALCLLAVPAGAAEKAEPSKPASRTVRKVEGWTVRIDDRLLQPPHVELGSRVLKSLEARLADINAVVRPDRLEKLHAVTIVLDLSHGKLTSAQYHPSADRLVENGYAADLVHCIHLPRAAELLEPRQINVQPWYVLHELAHAYHDQVLGFDDKRIRKAYENYKKSGHGDRALLVTGQRVRHYGLTNEKEFFAEMTESYFGMNDFFPFNRGELMNAEPEIYKLLLEIWGPVQTEPPAIVRQLKKESAAAPLPRLKPGGTATLFWYRKPAAKWHETAAGPTTPGFLFLLSRGKAFLRPLLAPEGLLTRRRARKELIQGFSTTTVARTSRPAEPRPGRRAEPVLIEVF